MLFSKEILKIYAERNNVQISDDCYDILSTELEYHLRELIQESNKLRLFSMKKKLTVSQINNVLKANNMQPIFGYSENSNFLNFKQSKKGDGNTFYIPDDEINLEDLLATNKKLLKESKVENLILNSHWLAIDNVQPDLPENVDINKITKNRLSDYQAETQIKGGVKHVLSTELKLYFEKVMDMIEQYCQENKFSNHKIQMTSFLEKLKTEVGIQQLVPYFVQVFNEKIVKTPEYSPAILIFYFSLIKNEYIFIDSHLHDIIPAILTIIVNIKYEAYPRSRRHSYEILKWIFGKYSPLYKNLGPRIINSLVKAAKNTDENIDNLSAVKAIFLISPVSESILKDLLNDGLNEEVEIYIKSKLRKRKQN